VRPRYGTRRPARGPGGGSARVARGQCPTTRRRRRRANSEDRAERSDGFRQRRPVRAARRAEAADSRETIRPPGARAFRDSVPAARAVPCGCRGPTGPPITAGDVRPGWRVAGQMFRAGAILSVACPRDGCGGGGNAAAGPRRPRFAGRATGGTQARCGPPRDVCLRRAGGYTCRPRTARPAVGSDRPCLHGQRAGPRCPSGAARMETSPGICHQPVLPRMPRRFVQNPRRSLHRPPRMTDGPGRSRLLLLG
jgi:hypothetical protein